MSALQLPPASPTTTPSASQILHPSHDDHPDSDADTASQRSIPLDSPAGSRRQSVATHDSETQRFLANPGAFLRANDKRESNQDTVDTDFSSDMDDMSLYKHRISITGETPNTSAPPSIYEEEPLTATKANMSIPPFPTSLSTPVSATTTPVTYPPINPNADDNVSITSLTSTASSRKARPESLLVTPPEGPLVLGIALVDFNHLVCHRYHHHINLKLI